ncbi:carboxypeptidase regulatory-like domain-containing protein [Porphyrobacter sp. YT40]|uniref:carboxypeptidase regulatory-like domain-containing protein n=1 Tax=Porphyrobacter sp. YT40 TaxID=2547601 RepID=UPI0011430A4A|nr:carboxypeptidase regulatory-like domain-containing protein [Porphyrobacter sp. YT40]QDH35757.1 carboxypeptidase regulatory-like domain-containing protein [Porphyrobacter sp. YT40]
MPDAQTLVALLIVAGALLAAVRLLLLRRRGWAGGALAALSLASGALLWCTLFPPLLPVGGETLVVATAETPPDFRADPGERLVALPEAPTLAGAERIPDLATALRRHGQVQQLQIIGRGLTARDRDADAGLSTRFDPLPLPRGLARLDPPADTPAGGLFALGGAANGMEGGSAELLDPAGRVVDSRVIGADGAFTLGGAARAPGLTTFTLRLRGRDKALVSDTPVPLRTLAAPQPLRVAVIGSPSPEVKYLRRWAEDAGFDLGASLNAGAGVDLGGGVRLDAASLRETDVVIIDDTALGTLGGGGRGALAQAVAGGLGVVVRMTGPASAAARSQWRALGLTVEGGTEAAPVALPPLAPDADALAALRGPGSADAPTGLNTLEDPVPELGLWTIRAGSQLVPAVTDAEGALVAGWQHRGQGRVLLWTLPESFALVLSGQSDRYAQWWSKALSAVARPDRQFRPALAPLVQTGERMAICGLAEGARITAPDGAETALAIDPAAGAAGCAAFWPKVAGVHTIIQPDEEAEERFDFLVLPDGALPTVRAAETGAATMLWAARQNAPSARTLPERRGPAWPWLLGWLALSAALWWGERRLRNAGA